MANNTEKISDAQIVASVKINNPKNFLNELTFMKSIVKGKNTIPVLDCVSIETENDKLTITGTDLDNTLETVIDCPTIKAGKFCLHLQTLINTIKKAKTEIELIVFDDISEYNAGTEQTPEIKERHELKTVFRFDGLTFKSETTDAENFPIVGDIKASDSVFELQATVLQDLLKKTVFSATADTSRFTLKAVALEPGKKGLRIIATDGQRASMAETLDFAEIKAKKGDKVPNFLLNLDAAKVAQKIIAGKVAISHDEHHLIIQTNGGTRKLIARKPTGMFPNYRMILPKDSIYSFDFHTKEVLPVVQTALTFAHEVTKSIVCQPYYNNFVFKSGGNEKSFTGKTSCDFPQNSAPAITFNGSFLVDVCNAAAGQTLKLNYKNTDNQFDIVGENNLCRFTFVIMPLRYEGDSDAFEILDEDEKAELKLIPFYKSFQETKATVKTDKKAVLADIKELLNELQTIAGIDGMPELFTEICLQTIGEAKQKLELL